jgi:hypothetical protein
MTYLTLSWSFLSFRQITLNPPISFPSSVHNLSTFPLFSALSQRVLVTSLPPRIVPSRLESQAVAKPRQRASELLEKHLWTSLLDHNRRVDNNGAFHHAETVKGPTLAALPKLPQ